MKSFLIGIVAAVALLLAGLGRVRADAYVFPAAPSASGISFGTGVSFWSISDSLYLTDSVTGHGGSAGYFFDPVSWRVKSHFDIHARFYYKTDSYNAGTNSHTYSYHWLNGMVAQVGSTSYDNVSADSNFTLSLTQNGGCPNLEGIFANVVALHTDTGGGSYEDNEILGCFFEFWVECVFQYKHDYFGDWTTSGISGGNAEGSEHYQGI